MKPGRLSLQRDVHANLPTKLHLFDVHGKRTVPIIRRHHPLRDNFANRAGTSEDTKQSRNRQHTIRRRKLHRFFFRFRHSRFPPKKESVVVQVKVPAGYLVGQTKKGKDTGGPTGGGTIFHCSTPRNADNRRVSRCCSCYCHCICPAHMARGTTSCVTVPGKIETSQLPCAELKTEETGGIFTGGASKFRALRLGDFDASERRFRSVGLAGKVQATTANEASD